MMKKIIALAGVALFSGMTFMAPTNAQAGNLSFEIGVGNPYGNIYVGRYYEPQRPYHYNRPHRPGKFCGPRRAVNKARHIGIRRAHIARVGHKMIIVKGFKRGRPVKVGFRKFSRHCKVAFVKKGRRVSWEQHGNYNQNYYDDSHNHGHKVYKKKRRKY